MRLTREELQFIDTYLINMDIQFIDVRMELLDHIATTLEKEMSDNNRSFYDAFKDYMVQHKKQLEKDYKKLRKDLQKKSFGILGRKMLTVPFLVLSVVSTGVLFVWESWFGVRFPYLMFVWLVHMVSVILYFVGMFPKAKYRFSSLETLAWPILLSTHFLNFFYNLFGGYNLFLEDYPLLVELTTSFFFISNMAWLALFYAKRKEVKLKLVNL
ncbi:hypothetical protein ACFQZJ_00290 [Maribacter chungangensis]|uniref:Uncharacterized protein n=1 Tax=Maribacter chungangensis TaxID=1069117 RepID=A0ABW3AYE4_9FLAO